MGADRLRSDWKGQLRKVKQGLRTSGENRVQGAGAASRPTAKLPVTKKDDSARPQTPARLFRKPGRPRAKASALPKWARKYCEENGIDPATAVVQNGRLQIRRNAPASSQTRPVAMNQGKVNAPVQAVPQAQWPWLTASSARPRFSGLARAHGDAQEWLSRGIRVQLNSAATAPKAKIRVLVGLDIGTAYTKVVAKVGGGDRYAISFEQAIECGNKFLLPAVLSVDGKGAAWLGEIPQSDRRFDDLKFRVIQRDDTQAQDAAFVAFMALVLRAARAWLFEKTKTLLGSRSIDWGYNVGMPTLPWEKAGLREKYQKLVEAALCASVTDGPVRLDVCERYLRHLPRQATGLRERISVFAEFAAQITGYVNSPRRREGPHLLVDVGAGTLDVTMFNVFQPPPPEDGFEGGSVPAGDTRFPIWDARVERLGSHYLAIARSVARGDAGAKTDAHAEVGETVEPLESYCQHTGADRRVVAQMETRFSTAISGEIAAVIRTTKVERYARFPWAREAVLTFICGGGSRYPLYESAVFEAAGRFPVKLERLPLPVPESLRAQKIADDLFDRLSVAYGLSFEPMEIGQVVPSQEIEGQARQAGPERKTLILGMDPTDRDQVE